MPTLSQRAIRQIRNSLDSTAFTQSAFDTSFNKPDGIIIEIALPDYPDFSFRAKRDGSTSETVECPGPNFVEPESYRLTNFNEIYGRITQLVGRILDELMVSTGNSEDIIKEMISNFTRIFNDLDNPNIPFNRQEAHEWMEKLDELVKKCEELRAKDELQQVELNQLRNEVNVLKYQVEKVPRKVWLKASAYRLARVFMERAASSSGDQVAVRVLKTLLGPTDQA